MTSQFTKPLLILTELGMLAYWVLAVFLVRGWVSISPEYMYSDYLNPLVVAWNWSFMPLDVLFALTGLAALVLPMAAPRRQALLIISLALMFCAGLMAISFWVIQGSFDPLWWGMNLWLMLLPFVTFVSLWRRLT